MKPGPVPDLLRRRLLGGLLAAAGLAALGLTKVRAGVRRVCRAAAPRRYPGPLRQAPSPPRMGRWAG